MTGPMWLGVGGAMVAVLVAAWLFSGRELASRKRDLLSARRAAVATVGAQWSPLAAQIEGLTKSAAGDFQGDFVADEARTLQFRSAPGLYLRLRVEDAKDADKLRRRAAESAKDGFTSCFLRPKRTRVASDAGPPKGPEQPWNLRKAFGATRILTEAWAEEVKASEDTRRLRVFEQQYEKAKAKEIPLAIEIVQRAEFFLLVLDEDVPEASEHADGGPVTEEHLQLVPHPARVHLLNLKTGQELLRLRRTGEADFRFAGERPNFDPELRAAMKRQVNNCALAQEVTRALAPPAPAAPAPGAGADAGAGADGGAPSPAP